MCCRPEPFGVIPESLREADGPSRELEPILRGGNLAVIGDNGEAELHIAEIDIAKVPQRQRRPEIACDVVLRRSGSP